MDVVGLGAGVDFLSKIGQAILDAKVKGHLEHYLPNKH